MVDSVYDNGGIVGTTLDFTATDYYPLEGTVPRGEAEYTTAGTFSWTAPAGAFYVSVIAVGGGGGGLAQGNQGGHGGGGGGLGWKNNIQVVGGQSYTVVVGSAGASVDNAPADSGGDSYFIDASTVAGLGGQGGADNSAAAGGGYVGDGGGNGGSSPVHTSTNDSTGGGGAGGYSGNGGDAGNINTNNAQAGSGGGGGGGGAGGSSDYGGAGGGVGIYGEGANGTAGAYSSRGNGSAGGGGSGGADGVQTTGGAFGGGGGGAELGSENGDGGGGAVRIIWGGDRAFPSTNTADGQGTTTGITAGNLKNSGIWSLSAARKIPRVSSVEFVSAVSYSLDSTTSVAMPSGLIEGDFVVFMAGHGGTGTSAAGTGSVPTGYTQIQKSVSSGNSKISGYAFMGATPDTTFNSAVLASSGLPAGTLVIAAFRNVTLAEPFNVSPQVNYSSTTPSISTTVSSAVVVVMKHGESAWNGTLTDGFLRAGEVDYSGAQLPDNRNTSGIYYLTQVQGGDSPTPEISTTVDTSIIFALW